MSFDGFDYTTTCNLCHTLRPSPRGDERLLRDSDYRTFLSGLSYYRTRAEAEVLIARWGQMYGVDVIDPADEVRRFIESRPSGLDPIKLRALAATSSRRRRRPQ